MRPVLYVVAAVWAVVLAAWWVRATLRRDCDEAGAIADRWDYHDALGDDR